VQDSQEDPKVAVLAVAGNGRDSSDT